MTRFRVVLLWLFVITLGISLGAGLYESRIVVPLWLDTTSADAPSWNASAAVRDDTGLRFWAFVSTGPLTLLTLLSFVAVRGTHAVVRGWWIRAAAVSLLERVFTFAYFVPTMIGLMASPDGASAVATATRWANLNHLRHALVLVALLAAMKALSTYREMPRPR